MIYAFSVVWAYLLYGTNTLEHMGEIRETFHEGFCDTMNIIKWILSVFDQSGTYNQYLVGGGDSTQVVDFTIFQDSVQNLSIWQTIPLILGTITTLIVAWGTVKLITRILQLKVR